jgi:hypothetical protein
LYSDIAFDIIKPSLAGGEVLESDTPYHNMNWFYPNLSKGVKNTKEGKFCALSML